MGVIEPRLREGGVCTAGPVTDNNSWTDSLYKPTSPQLVGLFGRRCVCEGHSAGMEVSRRSGMGGGGGVLEGWKMALLILAMWIPHSLQKGQYTWPNIEQNICIDRESLITN